MNTQSNNGEAPYDHANYPPLISLTTNFALLHPVKYIDFYIHEYVKIYTHIIKGTSGLANVRHKWILKQELIKIYDYSNQLLDHFGVENNK